MPWTISLDKVDKNSISLVGGKGANLGEMMKTRLPVPKGFVVTTDSYLAFISENRLQEKIERTLAELDIESSESLVKASEEIRKMVMGSQIPQPIENEIVTSYRALYMADELREISGKALDFIRVGRDQLPVAVRSSAVAEDSSATSFAGQMVSILNVIGPKQLLESVKRCWASLYEPRAIFYHRNNNVKMQAIAVIVQRLISADKAGVMFTADPVSGDRSKIIIEAAWGLGEPVVSGQVTPDMYTYDRNSKNVEIQVNRKETMRIRDLFSGDTKAQPVLPELVEAQVMSLQEISELVEFAENIQNHYGSPQDIEWCTERNKFYIVQTRPITTLDKKTAKEEKRIPEGEIILQGSPASPGFVTGKVKKIGGMSEFSKLNQGDILVTQMTTPDMVPIMKKTSAIITDTGGLTCLDGNTRLLTNGGFMDIRRTCEKVMKGDTLYVFSYDCENMKPVWKKIIGAGKRRARAIRISASQTGRMDNNYIDLTPDHKMLTFEGRGLIKKQINRILTDDQSLCLVHKLPETGMTVKDDKLSYLVGAIMSDGYFKVKYSKITGKPNKGYVIFTQNPTPEKQEFIQTVRDHFKSVFNVEFSEGRAKFSNSVLGGRQITGFANDYISSRLSPALTLDKIYESIDEWCLSLSESSALNYLAGLVDGDGCFANNRLHIYGTDEKILQSVILCCLKLGILPQIAKNRTAYNIQILERMEDVLNYTKRVKGIAHQKVPGTKLFSAKQILSDIVGLINRGGKILPYINKNLLIDSEKIRKRLYLIEDRKIKKELTSILDSCIRMHRVKKLTDIGEIDVFNIEVESASEINKNYVVFTSRYSPVLVSNSHAAIVSRELGIPCVVGTRDATRKLSDDDVITVDATAGKIYKGVAVEKEQPTEQVNNDQRQVELITATKIKVNLAFPERAHEAVNADGVGLLRAEHMLTESGKHPIHLAKEDPETLTGIIIEKLGSIAKTLYPKPIWYRSLDARTDEFKNLAGGENEPTEANPMLGSHGIRRSLEQQEMLVCELTAIKKLHEQGLDNIHLMIPFVAYVDEFLKTKQLAQNLGFPPTVKIGIMVEVPSAALTIDDFCKAGIAFASFGSNDLTQLVLGVDRNNERISALYRENTAAVLKLIKYVIGRCANYGVETSICGEAPSRDDGFVEKLVEYGINSISVELDALDHVKEVVARKEKEIIFKKSVDNEYSKNEEL
ncbi:MAG: phosphoenolpyruvate synthase [Candidatus Aenigmarchaeota archaeon]|nr:phosphoenolpyruvate synthase [Candidatus Aenigmarchaeota archaeon]